jgi:hypothetical protein
MANTQVTDDGVWHIPQKRPVAVVLPHAGAHIDDLLPQQATTAAATARDRDGDVATNDDQDSASDEAVPHDDDCGAGTWLCIDFQAGLRQKGLTSSSSSSSSNVSSTAVVQQQQQQQQQQLQQPQPAAAADSGSSSSSSSTVMAAA